MCFYISINACLLSGLYIYSILYPSWVRYGDYHVLINKHSLKRNQHDLNFSLLNTVSYFPLWQCPWGRQSAKINTGWKPRMMMSGLNILPVFKQHKSQNLTTIKLQKIKRKSYINKSLGFSYCCGCLLPCEIESITLLFQAIAFHPFIYSLTNHLLTAYLVNNIIRYANYDTMNISDTCHHFFFSLSFANLGKIKIFYWRKFDWLYFL